MATKKQNQNDKTENQPVDAENAHSETAENQARETSSETADTVEKEQPETQAQKDSPEKDGDIEEQTPLAEKEPENRLESLNALANRFRVAAWQQAALLRFTGWMDDRPVTEAEYKRELENLKNRRIGGGRR